MYNVHCGKSTVPFGTFDASIKRPLEFLQAADEFIAEHPEILRRLAQ